MALILLFTLVIAACASLPTVSPTLPAVENGTINPTLSQTPAGGLPEEMQPTQVPQSKVSILEALPNAVYPIELASGGKAQLKDGYFEEEAAPGSATKTKITLGKLQAVGDVNGDGLEDALVTLVADPGGSGTFTYLALVLNQDGKPEPLAAVMLGDRIIVKSLSIQNGIVQITMFTRKPDEPMSVEPTVEVDRIFNFQNNQLVESK